MKLISRSPRLLLGMASDTGRRKKNEPNQDSIAAILPNLIHPQPPLLLVADGMGGHYGGATASRLVVNSISQQYRSPWISEKPNEVLESCVQKAHADIKEYGAKKTEFKKMGSTVVGVLLLPTQVFFINVGDSRGYLYHEGEIHQLSQDQSLVGGEVRAGQLTPEEAIDHPKRNVLTMSLTALREAVTCFHAEADWEPNDAVILCTDGLWSVVPDSIIQAVVSELGPASAAKKLVELANASQTPDNVSVVVAAWDTTEARKEDH